MGNAWLGLRIVAVGDGQLVVDNWLAVVVAIAAVAAVAVNIVYTRATFNSVSIARDHLRRSEQGLFADLLLRLDAEMPEHRQVHEALRPGGEWSDSVFGPRSNDEWIAVEAYMGMFERINYFVNQQLTSIDYVKRFYGYRYENIVHNRLILEKKLKREQAAWLDFVELGRKLGVDIPLDGELTTGRTKLRRCADAFRRIDG